MIARGAITRVPDDDFGSVRMQNVVPRFVRDGSSLTHAARDLGHDNARILGQWLGVSAAEQERLRRLKVI